MATLDGGTYPGSRLNGYIVRSDEKILITGANGFIGTNVLKVLLEYGFSKIRCLVRSDRNISKLKNVIGNSNVGVELIQGNLLSRDDCSRAAEDVSIVYHLAAGVEKSFPGCFMNSAVTTRNLIEALLQNRRLMRFVNISSLAVYSNAKIPRGGLLDEFSEIDNRLFERWDAYTYGKSKQDQILIEYAKKHNLPYVIVRPGVVFGPGKAAVTARIGIDTFGIFLHLGLNNKIPFTYVENCAEAVVLAGLKKGIDKHVFNILDDDLPKSHEFLKQFKRQVGSFISIPVPYPIWYGFCFLWEKYSKWSEGQLPPVFNRKKAEIFWKRMRYSNKKAKEMLGWSPRVTMKDGLERYFQYMKEMKGN